MKKLTKTYLYTRDENGARCIWTPDTTPVKEKDGMWDNANYSGTNLIADDESDGPKDITGILGKGFHGLRKGRKTLIKVEFTDPKVTKI